MIKGTVEKKKGLVRKIINLVNFYNVYNSYASVRCIITTCAVNKKSTVFFAEF